MKRLEETAEDICYKRKLIDEGRFESVNKNLYDCDRCPGKPRSCPNYISYREIMNGAVE